MFKPPRSGCATTSRLESNGTIIENESKILSVWAKHFEELGTSKVDPSSQLKDTVAIMFVIPLIGKIMFWMFPSLWRKFKEL